MSVCRGVGATTARRRAAKIARPAAFDFSDSDSEMSFEDRGGGSPILLESGLKSFLGHPGHNFPLINDAPTAVYLKKGRFTVPYYLYFDDPNLRGNPIKSLKIEGSNWPRGNYCCPAVITGPDRGYQVQHYNELSADSSFYSWTDAPAYYDPRLDLQCHRRFSNNAGNSKPAHPHSHGHSTIKDLASSIIDDKIKDDGELWNPVEAQTAFLGPNLWDKTYETDLKYVDLDEFLSENGVSMDGLGTHTGSLGPLTTSQALPKRERSPSPSDCMSPDTMNPSSPADSNEDLKPQPLIKKSRKQFVPDDLKDDKYWARRRKNNLAAKRSRDARRMKENQIALRAGYLEKENMGLRQELERLKKENLLLQNKLSKYEDV